MSKFAKIKYKHGVPEQEVIHEVYNLKVNGKNIFNDFLDKIPKNQESEKIVLLTNLLKIVRGTEETLPDTKYKRLKRDKKDKFVDYELKTKHLRLYFFKEDNNRIIVLGGTKKNQKKDLSKFRTIKQSYFSTCTQKKN